MTPNRASRTAKGVAAIRAAHQIHDNGCVLDDPVAEKFLSASTRRAIKNPLLYRSLSPLVSTVTLRARLVEDCLAELASTGCRQYVLLGAGFDSFAFRCPESLAALEVFEFDHPATQQAKRAALEKAQLVSPENLHFCPIDFETESLTEVLSHSSLDPDQPSVWSWMGVTHYLTEAAVRDTLAAIATYMRAPTHLLFDYSIPPAQLSWAERQGLRVMNRLLKRWGEPLIGHWSDEAMLALVKECGWQQTGCWNAADQRLRYRDILPNALKLPEAIRITRIDC